MDAETHAKKQAEIRELIRQYYPDAHRISVTLAANGLSRHLRWQYTEDLEPQQADVKSERDPSPALSQASTVPVVDRDGDSPMPDAEEDRYKTPKRELPYNPGSVLLTPRKNGGRVMHHEGRMGMGAVANERLRVQRDKSVSPEVYVERRGSLPPAYYAHPELPPQPIDPARIVPWDRYMAEEERDSPQRDESPYSDSSDASVWSVATEATVIINPDDPEEPTLFNNEKPFVREPTWPVEDGDEPGPVAGPAQPGRLHGRLSTIQEEGSSSSAAKVQAWTSKVPRFGPVRLFRSKDGDWVREGSLGPDAIYQIDRSILPPRVDQVMEDAAPQAGPSSMPSRAGPSRAGPSKAGPSAEAGPSNGGAKGRAEGKRPARLVPVVVLPTIKQVRAAAAAEAQLNAKSSPRRSARLRELKLKARA